MELITDQPKDKVKDEILLKNRCFFSQKQFLGSKGAKPLANEEVSGIVSDMYAAMDEYAGSLISQRVYTEKITEIPKEILDQYARQEAIGFLNWCAAMGYEYSGPDHETGEPLFGVLNGGNQDAKTVYNEYLKSKPQ